MRKFVLQMMFFSVLVLLSFSCKKKDAPIATKKRYILSNEYNNTTNAASAKYFVNDVETTLGDPVNTKVYGEDLEVSGTDVYVLAIRQPLSGASSTVVIYKNGTELQSFATPNGIYYNCLAVSGNDIYLAGIEYPSGGVGKIILWKNGSVSSITNNTGTGATDARVYDMLVVGADVYLAGYETTSSGAFNRLPKYWKNGQATTLGAASGVGSSAHRIVLVNNDVYCAGESEGKPIYWKNGTATNLSTSSGWCYGIALSGSDVYAAGSVSTGSNIFNAVSWKNGSQNLLSNITTQGTSSVYGIGVDGSDVYIIGSLPNASNSSAKSVYWKNGTMVELPTAAGSNGYAYRLVIK